MSSDNRQQEELEALRAHLEREFCSLYERQLDGTCQLVCDPEFLALSPDEKSRRLDEHTANQDLEMNGRLDELTRELPFDSSTRAALRGALNLGKVAILAAAGTAGEIGAWGMAVHTLCKELIRRQDVRIDEHLQLDREFAEQRSPEERRQDEIDNAMLAVSHLSELPETVPPQPAPELPAPREAPSFREQLDVADAMLEGFQYLPPGTDTYVNTISAGSTSVSIMAHGLDAAAVAKGTYHTLTDSPDLIMEAWDAANMASSPLAVRNADTLDRIRDAIRKEPDLHKKLDAMLAERSAGLSARQACGDLSVHERAQQHEQLEKVITTRRFADVTQLYEQALQVPPRDRDLAEGLNRAGSPGP